MTAEESVRKAIADNRVVGTLDSRDPKVNWNPNINGGYYYINKDSYYMFVNPVEHTLDNTLIPIAKNVSYTDGYNGTGILIEEGTTNLAPSFSKGLTRTLSFSSSFAEEGLALTPTTWDELRADAKKLSGNGVYGLGVSGVNTEEGTFQFMPWLLSAGATPFKVDGPEGIKAFTFVSDLVKDGSMPKDVMNWVQSDVNKQFEAGNLAMMINGPWQLPSLAKDTPDLKFGVALIPKDQQYASVLGGEDWGVVNGKNVDAAIDFLKFVVSPDLMKDYCNKFGYFPSRKDMASDPVFTSDPIKKVFVDEMQYASPRGPSAQWPQLSLAISTALQEVITGSKTPEAAAKTIEAKAKEVLKPAK
jgi:multiple sugar transport system substrate-binding protein